MNLCTPVGPLTWLLLTSKINKDLHELHNDFYDNKGFVF